MKRSLNLQTKVIVALVAVAMLLTLAPASVLQQAEARTSFANRRAVIRTANSLLGRPYVFGANGPRSFDCSSFVRYVYRQHGYFLPRTSRAQSTVGTFVPLNQLMIGDLMFYRDTWTTGISHVGIYAGNRRMIHAWPRSGVTYDSIDGRYLRSRYAGARRILR